MSDYNGCYVKLSGNPAYWAVDGGERRLVHSQAEMVTIGIRQVVTVSQEELDDIPVKGQHRKAPRPAVKPVSTEKKAGPEKNGEE
jgi:hypothetical protein